jgi:hypothetical protein
MLSVTPPGNPLIFYEGYPLYRDALAHYQTEGFGDLGDNILEVIRNAKLGDAERNLKAGEVRRLWSLKLKNSQVLHGMLGMVESRNDEGKNAVFQFLYTSGNDGRYLFALTVGPLSSEEKEAFRLDHGGKPHQGDRS